jgi:hypothetical protein
MSYSMPKLVQLGAAQSIVLGEEGPGHPDSDPGQSFQIELW